MELAKPHLRLFRASVAAAAMLLAASAHGYEARFIDSLSPQEKAASGITKLTAAQVAALDVLVSHDATLAEQGGVTRFSSGFLARHPGAEREAAGISRLSDSEQATLDTLVARTIALGPPPDQPFTYKPPQAKPAPPPAPSEVAVTAPPQMEVHGDLSFTFGAGGHGSNFYGTSMDLNVTDPSGKFTLGVGFDDYRGKGPLALYGPYSPYGPFGLYGPYSAYGPIGPAYVGPPYWGP
jgi:hypothetical protein